MVRFLTPLALRLAVLFFAIGTTFLTLQWISQPRPALVVSRPPNDRGKHNGNEATEGQAPPQEEKSGQPGSSGHQTNERPAVPTRHPMVGETFDDDDEDEDEAPDGWHPLPPDCHHYTSYSRTPHQPLSTGKFKLGFQRPSPSCRSFNSSLVEKTITRMKGVIKDPDLYRIFENTFPNTLDTAIKWKGVAANNSAEELCFVITGDIDAMWLRDSANQLQVYRPVMSDATDDIASIYRGTINLQARYIILAPYCNAFQPPPEAEIPHGHGGGGSTVFPSFDPSLVSTCNFELDSFAAFLQLSHDYHEATGDVDFFGKFQWISAVETMLKTARDMMEPTYGDDGKRLTSPYTFQSYTTTMTGTLNNVGTGNPVARTGLVRSPFRPSDDTSVFEFLVPANMMFARYLESTAHIMSKLKNAPSSLAKDMSDMASTIRKGITEHAVVPTPDGKGKMYAYEVDGFGGQNLMDDANVPSLLSAPFIGYVDRDDEIYQNTRKFVLSSSNPWYCRGPVINGIGSTHIKPGAAWPMASTIQIMTSDDDAEIEKALVELLWSTNGIGLMHESVSSWQSSDFTRPWFSWANGLFGQMILDLEQRKPRILAKSFQSYPIPHGTDIGAV